ADPHEHLISLQHEVLCDEVDRVLTYPITLASKEADGDLLAFDVFEDRCHVFDPVDVEIVDTNYLIAGLQTDLRRWRVRGDSGDEPLIPGPEGDIDGFVDAIAFIDHGYGLVDEIFGHRTHIVERVGRTTIDRQNPVTFTKSRFRSTGVGADRCDLPVLLLDT